MARSSLQTAPWATRWYGSAAAFLALGIVAGMMLARGVGWPHGDLLAAHMVLNLGGWFGAAIVGTLHTFYPSLTKTQLRYPHLQALALVGWTAGVATLVAGYGWSVEWLSVAGWLGLALAGLALLINVAAALRGAARPLTLPARLVGLGQPFLLAGLALAGAAAIAEGPANAVAGSTRDAIGTLLVAGWVGLTVLGSLLHLLALVIRVRNLSSPMPAPRPGPDSLIALAAAVGVAAMALSQSIDLSGLRAPASALLLAAYAVLAGKVGLLGVRIARRARPSI
jgi:hypothetical protein